MRRYEFHVPEHPPDLVAAERLEAIAADQERAADALERIADAMNDDGDLVTDGGTEVVPWCPSCQSFSVPVADGTCGKCGSTVEFKEDDR